MSDLYLKLKQDLLSYRKNKNNEGVGLLTTLIGDLDTKRSKEKTQIITDELVISTIKAFIKNIDTYLAIKDNPLLVVEKQILNTYLPQVLDVTGTKLLVQSMIDMYGFDKPKIMQHIKSRTDVDKKSFVTLLQESINESK